MCEGGPGWLELIDVKINKNEVSFTIPAESLWAGSFKGRLTEKGLKGKLNFIKASEGNQIMEIDLPRKKSYWD